MPPKQIKPREVIFELLLLCSASSNSDATKPRMTESEAISAIVKKYDMKADSVRYALRKHKQTKPAAKGLSHHGNQTLSVEEEASALALIQFLGMGGKPIPKRKVIATIINKSFPGANVDKFWVARFLKKHRKLISQRKLKTLCDKRRDGTIVDEVKVFCDEVGEELDAVHYPDFAIFNADEKRCVIRGDKSVVVTSAEAGRSQKQGTRRGKAFSVLPFFGADGSVGPCPVPTED